MPWSTREIAELAGTSLRAVRHYHQVGLLPEPERRANGYKQYDVTHLVRLLRITRLVDLGFGLTQIAELGDRDEHPEQELRALGADLTAQIERLQRLKTEVAAILQRRVPTDLPPEFAAVATRASTDQERQLASVLGRVLGDDERATYAELLTEEARSPSDDDFDALPADADADRRDDLARRMVDDLYRLQERYPAMESLGASDPARYRRVVERVSAEVMNPAQLDVLRRLRTIVRAERERRG